jgi:hypothetical protein
MAASGIADTDLMIDLPHGPSGLSRATWTDSDLTAVLSGRIRPAVTDCQVDKLPYSV